MSDSGFVAGTLVHTDKGPIPIQDIKVGDRVLSKSEKSEGALEYKAVVSTFKSPVKEDIYKVEYYNVDAYERGEKGTSYLFCTDNHPFWISKQPIVDANATLKGEWLPAFNIPAGHLTTVHGEEIELTDYAIMPVRTLPNFPDGCAYVQRVEEHDDGWNDSESVEFVQFNKDSYQYVSLAEEEEGYHKKIEMIAAKTSDAKLHLNQQENFKVDETLYKTLNIRFRQDKIPYSHSVDEYIEVVNSPLLNDDGIEVRKNRIVNQEVYELLVKDLESYGDATGLLDQSIHKQMQNYYDPAPNPYEDYVYNIEVADYHTYFVGYDGIWVADQ